MLLRRRRQRETGGKPPACAVIQIEARRRYRRRLEVAGRKVQVFHEEAADQIVVVPEAVGPHVSRGQQQARVLDASGREDEAVRRDAKANTAQGRHLHALHRRSGRGEIERDDVGVKINANARSRGHLRPVLLAEASRWAQRVHAGQHAFGWKRQARGPTGALPERHVVFGRFDISHAAWARAW